MKRPLSPPNSRTLISRFTAGLLTLFVLVALAAPGHAFYREWINPAGGSFFDNGNWSPFGAPSHDEDAIFGLGQEAPYQVTLNQFAIIWDLIVETDKVSINLDGNEFQVFNGLVGAIGGAKGHLEVKNGTLMVDQNFQVGHGSGSEGTFILENATMDVTGLFRGPMNNTSYANIELRDSVVDVFRFEVLRDADVKILGTKLTATDDIRFAGAGDANLQHVTRVLVGDGSHVITHRNLATSNNANNLTELTVTGDGTIFELTGETEGGDWNGSWLGDAVVIVEGGAALKVANTFRPGGAGHEEVLVTDASVEVGGLVRLGHRSLEPLSGGSAVLTLNNSTMTSHFLENIGHANYSSGSVILRNGSVWTSQLAASNLGSSTGSTGSMSIESGSHLTLSETGSFQIGAVETAVGSLTVTGANSRLEGATDMFVGGSRKVAHPIPGTGDFEVPQETPAELPVTSGLALWFAADEIDGLQDGDPVSQWSDLSNNGYHLSQPNADARPTFVADGVNGKPVVRFDGDGHHLLTGAFSPQLAQANHVFLVLFADDPSGGRVFDRPSSVGGGRQTVRTFGDRLNAFAGLNLNGTVTDWEKWHLFEVLFNQGESRVGGKTVASFALDAGNIGSNSMGSLILGSHANGTSEFFRGDVAEMIIFDRALSDEEVEAVENYLAGKYALPLAVPGTGEVDYTGAGGLGDLVVTDGGFLGLSNELFIWETGTLTLNGGQLQVGELGFSNVSRQVEVTGPTEGAVHPEDPAEELPVTDGLTVWLAADALELTDGDPVAEWTDLSGLGHHISQPNEANRPLYVADGLNGKPAIRFDGVNDHLYMPSRFSPEIEQPNHIFIVFQANRPSGGDRVFDRGPAGGDRQTLRLTASGGELHAGSGIGGGFSDSGWNIHEILFNDTNSHWYARTLGLAPMGQGAAGDRRMGALQLGIHNNQSSDPFDGNIAEFIMFNRQLSDEEIEAVEHYLAGKYSLPVWGYETETLDLAPTLATVVGGSANSTVEVAGNLVLGETTRLNLALASGYEPGQGETFTLATYGGSRSGHFAGLPEGATIELGGRLFQISYAGGAVTLTETSGPAGVSFSDWIAGFDLPEGQEGPEANPSGDGIANAIKYALGMDPTQSSRAELPEMSVEEFDGKQYLTLEVIKNPDAVNVSYTVEVSGDLAVWEDGEEAVAVVEEDDSILIARDKTALEDAGSRFIRVRIELE